MSTQTISTIIKTTLTTAENENCLNEQTQTTTKTENNNCQHKQRQQPQQKKNESTRTTQTTRKKVRTTIVKLFQSLFFNPTSNDKFCFHSFSARCQRNWLKLSNLIDKCVKIILKIEIASLSAMVSSELSVFLIIF